MVPFNRFKDNAANYAAQNFAGQLLDGQLNIQAIARNQAQVSRPCCGPCFSKLRAQVEHPLPFIPSASTQALGLKCCKQKWQKW